MDAFLTSEILAALQKGDVKSVLAYGLIFIVIWIEVRGLKKEFKTLNTNISASLAKGEIKFEQIEKRLDDLELTKSKGGLNNEKAVVV